MIIKRRVTRGFVQIANEVVRDRNLALDEHGLLHYLLSLPDDWEVNLRHLEKYWSIGRDKRRRLFRALRKTGWARLERIETEDGTFLGQRWIIGDEPGPEITDEAINAEDAAGEDAAKDDDATPMNTTAAPESQAPDALVAGHRETPFQAVGSSDGRVSRPPENTSLPIRKTLEEEIQNTNTMADASSNDEHEIACEPPPRFGELLRQWPADNITSSYASEKSFNKLSDWQKRQAFHGIKRYLDDCRSKGQTRLCDLRTYLDERRFERFSGRGAPAAPKATIQPYSAEFHRWREYRLAMGDHEGLRVLDVMAKLGKEITVPSQWPPPLPPEKRSAEKATNGTLCTEDDMKQKL
jgi:hypothetical protein